MKKRIVWLLCVALVLCLSLPSWADESVVRFAGEAEKFVYLPEDGDLFTDFKGVMPGDVRTQTVVVTNAYAEKVDIYLQAEGASEADKAFLSALKLAVVQGERVLFDGTADESDGLSARTLLGSFEKGQSATLLVTLTVPATLDNAFMDASGDVIWTFFAEQQAVRTGDDSRLLPYAIIGGVLLSVMVGTIELQVVRRKRNRTP